MYDDLATQFEAADEALGVDAAGFTSAVMVQVQRRAITRRLVLAAASVLGAGLAAVHMPDLLVLLNGIVGMRGDEPMSTGFDLRFIAIAGIGAAALIATLTVETDW